MAIAFSAQSTVNSPLLGGTQDATQTVALAIYDAVESGNGTLARALVVVVSAVALAILSLSNVFGPKQVQR